MEKSQFKEIKSQFKEIKNPLFNKVNSVHRSLEKILRQCQEFEDTEEYPLIKNQLSKSLKLINDLRVKFIKDPQ